MSYFSNNDINELDTLYQEIVSDKAKELSRINSYYNYGKVYPESYKYDIQQAEKLYADRLKKVQDELTTEIFKRNLLPNITGAGVGAGAGYLLSDLLGMKTPYKYINAIGGGVLGNILLTPYMGYYDKLHNQGFFG